MMGDLSKRYSKVAKPIVEKVPGLKWVGQDPTNFFTGFRLTKPAAAIAVTGILGTAAAKTGIAYKDAKTQSVTTANAQDQGIMPSMAYEQTGGRRDLGATGDLVFGLHNMRRG
jgi:hypothetical protein